MGEQLLQHINQSIMHLFRIELKQLYDIQLLQALDELVSSLGVLFQDEGKEVHHLPDKIWHLEGIE